MYDTKEEVCMFVCVYVYVYTLIAAAVAPAGQGFRPRIRAVYVNPSISKVKTQWTVLCIKNNYRSISTTSALVNLFVGKLTFLKVMFEKFQKLIWEILIYPLILGLLSLKI